MTTLPMVASQVADETLLDQICGGDDQAFNELVVKYHDAMIRVARAHVRSDALAEEAAQDAWLAILNGCRRFERRSSLKTWMFRIVINRARTHAAHEHRGDWLLELTEASADDVRFHPNGSWAVPPRSWTPEERLLAGEVRQRIDKAIANLPPMQQQVITLRDVCGWSGDEVCDLFAISGANQRILLHRARAKVRQSLEEFMCSEERSCTAM
ncbi:MAG TPA: RNA polymerase sigma factor [Thermoanaerobaculia bacterium]|nr:RNA polymerase sigma factor [Thermoanaerobaculia bacterium]